MKSFIRGDRRSRHTVADRAERVSATQKLRRTSAQLLDQVARGMRDLDELVAPVVSTGFTS